VLKKTVALATLSLFLLLIAFAGMVFGAWLFLRFYVFGESLENVEVIQWLLARFWVLFTGFCFVGAILGILVDRVILMCRGAWTEKRKREWNFGQHHSE
jgi:hypothetical protein